MNSTSVIPSTELCCSLPWSCCKSVMVGQANYTEIFIKDLYLFNSRAKKKKMKSETAY